MDIETAPSLDVGLISDTHLPYRMQRLPSQVLEVFRGVDVILHAGDVDKPGMLEPLQRIAPVHAVRGNVHFLDLSSGGISLPHLVELRLARRRVLLTHGYLPGLAGLWFKGRDVALRLMGASEKGCFNERIAGRLERLYPQADIIVFGHTHRAYVRRIRSTLLINPGAVSPTWREQPSVARMRLGDGEPQVEIITISSGSK